MLLRVFTEPQQGASYDDQLAVARKAEECGFDAFFRSDHYLVMGDRDGLPGPTDSWITLAGLARETTRIRLGTLVTSATFRNPGVLAISVAQVDRMSGGRIEFGLGTGWFADEHRAYGIEFPDTGQRFDRLTEQLDLITGLWTTPPGERYSFAGQHYTVTDSPALPKPAQEPHPPIIIGGTGPKRTPALVARYAAEYNAAFVSPARTGELFERSLAACAEVGRDPSTLALSAAQVLCVGRDDLEFKRRAAAIGREPEELIDNGLAGSPAQVIDRIGRFAELGAGRIYLQTLDLSDLDHLELVAAEIMPQVA